MPTQRQIRSAIYLSGIKPIGYVVHHDLPGASFTIPVPTVLVGNIIVRALRAQAGESHATRRLTVSKRDPYATRVLPRRDQYGTCY